MEHSKAVRLLNFYRRQLLEDVVPFWAAHAPDPEYGGYFTCLGRDGSMLSGDKYVWLQGRGVWTFSALYHRVEARTEWLELARLGFEFLRKHGRDQQGQWHFHLRRDGQVVQGPISVYSDFFAVYGLAEYFRAAGDEGALRLALDTYWSILRRIRDPKFQAFYPFPEAQDCSRHTLWMILLEVTQELNEIWSDPRFQGIIEECVQAILDHHARPADGAILENLTADFNLLDSPGGRLINPGHGFESAWFVMHQGRRRGDVEMIRRAAQMVEWSYLRGWDREEGGIFAFVDLSGSAPESQEWFHKEGLSWSDKVWWVHSEALYALLLAHHLSGDFKFLNWYDEVQQWTFSHFSDPRFGEWFPYLSREGRPKADVKGNPWKGPFHVPRALLLCLKLLEKVVAEISGE